MPRQKITHVYTFDELSEKARARARDWYRTWGIDSDWRESIYDDAERIGLKITGCSWDYNHVNATGRLLMSMDTVIDLIRKEHGKDYETTKLAEQFAKQRQKLTSEFEHGEEDELRDAMDRLEASFEEHLVEEYAALLQKEYEYLNSDEYIDEVISTNDYEFSEDGSRV